MPTAGNLEIPRPKKLRTTQRDIGERSATIAHRESIEEYRRFFRDLLTESEIREFAERWKVACLLAQAIADAASEKETGLRSRTIARVHKWLKRGKGVHHGEGTS